MSGSRRESRELALQVLFQREFSQAFDYSKALEFFGENFPVDRGSIPYAQSILVGVDQNSAPIDQLIETCSQNWSMKRMALIDLIIMRIATFEMRFAGEPLPVGVVIDEAIELAKKYGTTESASFINGIMDQIQRK